MGPTRTQGRPARSRRLTLDNADGGSGICAQQSGYPLQDGIWQAHRLIPRTEMLCSKVGLCGFTTPLRTPPFPHTCVRLSQAPRPDEQHLRQQATPPRGADQARWRQLRGPRRNDRTRKWLPVRSRRLFLTRAGAARGRRWRTPGRECPLEWQSSESACQRLYRWKRHELPVLSAWEPTGYQAHTQTRLPSGYPRRHQPRGQMSGETPQPPKASNASRLPVAQARPAPRLGGAKDESWGEIPQNALPERRCGL